MFVKEVLAEVADWFRGESCYTTLDARDPRFWAALVIVAVLLVPTLAAVQIAEQVLG
jgi:hypothetical protein